MKESNLFNEDTNKDIILTYLFKILLYNDNWG